MKKEIIKKLERLEKEISEGARFISKASQEFSMKATENIKEITKAVIQLEDEEPDVKIYTKDELRKLEEVVHNQYVTEDAVWMPDFDDKTSIDNVGTVLVTSSKTRLRRQYAGAIQSDWFKGYKETIELFNYLFKEFDEVDINAGFYEVDVAPGLGNNFVLSGLNKKVKFHKDALIKIKPNNLGGRETKSEVFSIGEDLIESKNITLNGLRIQGEKHQHGDVKGEWFRGLRIGNVKDSIIKNTTITEMWGDGVVFGHHKLTADNKFNMGRNENVMFEDFLIDDCGRNGITVSACYNLTIQNGKTSRNDRTNPKSGIDFELEEGTRLYGPWGDMAIDDITIRNVEACDNPVHGIILFSHTGKVLIDNCNVHSNGRFGITSRHNNGTQIIRNTKTDGLLLHNLWKGNKFIVEGESVLEVVSIQNNAGGIVEINDSKMSNVTVKWWESGSLKVNKSETKVIAIHDLASGDVEFKKTKIDAKSYGGYYAFQTKGEIDKVKVEDCEITGANRWGHCYGVIIDKSTKIDKPEDIQIINNKFYNNSRTAKIEVPITFEGNTDEQGEIIKL